MNILKKIIEWPASRAYIFTIDFSKPWWYVFWQQRLYVLITVIYLIVDDVFSTLVPLILGYVLVNKSIKLLLVVQAIYILLEVLGWLTYNPSLTRIYNQIQDSFHYSAYNQLLSVDPMYHVRRSSGTVIGKIKRTSNAYLDLMSTFVDDALPFVVELVTVLVSVFIINIYLGILIFSIVLVIGLFFSISIIFSTRKLERYANEQDDLTSQMSTECLSQAQFIRASFATSQVQQRLLVQHEKQLKAEIVLWMTYPIIQGFFIILYIIGTGFIITFLIHLIKQGRLDSVLATTLLLTYFRGTRKLFSLDSMLLTMIKSYRRIVDFYIFIQAFGQKSFPIFSEEGKKDVEVDLLSPTKVILNHVTFSYPYQPPIFIDISLNLSVEQGQENKLYGIIGPSGIGKTTFISVLGGQLKPHAGYVLINGIDAYTVNDDVRRKLIALQGQIATSLRGSLKYNLLFGLPDDFLPSDQSIVDVLTNVGLWKLFAEKDGLNTYIGEGGLNLSGGQRQRLNFANLYLRAKFYKPVLILIDEPTSSLDEMSERALTVMIDELAHRSVTFVIAHRLKTLNQAHQLLDFSLLGPKKILQFHAPEELKSISTYFDKLLSGVTKL